MDNIKGVLVPTDFSPTAWQAVLAGIKIARISRAPLNLIHITQPGDDTEYLEEVKSKLQNISENLAAIYDVIIQSTVALGEPREEIERILATTEVDLIIMGLNGTGGNEIGSLTGYVMHHLNCPIMIVPSSKPEPVLI